MSRLRHLEATAHHTWYRPPAQQAAHNIRHLTRLLRRYQALTRAHAAALERDHARVHVGDKGRTRT